MVRISATVLLIAMATGAHADCACRFAGGTVVQGQTACIKTATGESLARCEMNQNVSSWTILNQPCPIASVAPDLEPDEPSKPVSG
jgi:hypothetical protein